MPVNGVPCPQVLQGCIALRSRPHHSLRSAFREEVLLPSFSGRHQSPESRANSFCPTVLSPLRCPGRNRPDGLGTGPLARATYCMNGP
jgi:hypothetical protein